MVRFVHEVVIYTKINIRYKVLISKMMISGNILVLDMLGIATFTAIVRKPAQS
jgi:hypothetical protein